MEVEMIPREMRAELAPLDRDGWKLLRDKRFGGEDPLDTPEFTLNRPLASEIPVPAEYFDHLQELGYLEGQDAPAARQAMAQLLYDAYGDPAFAQALDDGQEPQMREAQLMDLLGDLITSANGARLGRRFNRVPQIGEASLWVRVLKARLNRLLETFHWPGGAWCAEDREAVRRIAHLVTPPNEKATPAEIHAWRRGAASDDWVAATGNTQQLLTSLMNSGQWKNKWFAARAATTLSSNQYRQKQLTVDHGKFAHKIIVDASRHQDQNKTWENSSNKLCLRLVQMRLAELGYYLGDINGRWDKETFTALDDLAHFMLLSPVSKYLYHLKPKGEKSFVAINLHGLCKDLLFAGRAKDIVDAADEATQLEALDQELGQLEDKDIETKKLAQLEREARDKVTGRGGLGKRRRLFFTPWRILRAAFALARKPIGRAFKIIERALAPVAMLFHAARLAASRLWWVMSRALYQFGAFVLGLPYGVASMEGVVLAKADLDRDTVCFCIGPRLEGPLAQFALLQARLLSGLRIGLGLAAIAFEIARLAIGAPLSWIRLALRGLALVRREMRLAALERGIA